MILGEHSNFELLSSPMRALERSGTPGAIASMLLGVGLMVAGIYLGFGWHDGHYWPKMLILAGFGLGFFCLGASYYVGPKRALRMAMGYQQDPANPRATTEEAGLAAQASLPFWVCSSCRIVRGGVSSADRCMQCGSVTDYFEVRSEPARSTAVSMLAADR